MTLKELRNQIASYEKSTTKNSIWQLANTLIPFVLLWFFAYRSLSISYILTFILTVAAAGFVVRLFIIFHDCCHFSFFKNRTANKIVGTITGVLTLFPYEQWAHDHAVHHATSSNLDKRGTGDLWILTVKEYREASPLVKLGYRLYRNPFIMLVLGPIYQFMIINRFNHKAARKKERINTYLTNLLLVIVSGLLVLAVGWKAFLLVEVPTFLIAGSAGIWLFYVQHTFEDSYFEDNQDWDYVKAAVEGSSYYKLPKLLQWLTGNIGFHHVHHLSPRIPNYRLESAHNHTQLLQKAPTITLSESIRCLRFHLWDEENKKFVGFNKVKEVSKKPIAVKMKPELK
jgi:omega-6 fatty acid desaturase (delta-12 desaturase)